MLADEIIAGRGGTNDRLLLGAFTALGDDIRKAARFDLSPGAVETAHTIHGGDGSLIGKCLTISRFPFQRCWFEWPGDAGWDRKEAPRVKGPDRFAPVPSRVGVLVTVDDSRQRGIATWAWFTKEGDQGLNLSPLSIAFDWREEFEPLHDLDIQYQAVKRKGLDLAEYNRRGVELDRKAMPRIRSVAEEVLIAERGRFAVCWSPYAVAFSKAYEEKHGPIHPGHPLFKAASGDIEGELGILQAILVLMNSRNMTKTEPVAISPKLNTARAKRNKPALLDYSTVKIRLSRALAQRAGATGERQASRMHVVAGHFKIRKSGIYWWNDHPRGNASRGVIRQQTRELLE